MSRYRERQTLVTDKNVKPANYSFLMSRYRKRQTLVTDKNVKPANYSSE